MDLVISAMVGWGVGVVAGAAATVVYLMRSARDGGRGAGRLSAPGGFGMFSEAGETLIERLVDALVSGIGEGVTAEQIARAVEHIQDAASDLGHNEAHDSEVRWAMFRRLASAAVPYEALRAEWLRDGAS